MSITMNLICHFFRPQYLFVSLIACLSGFSFADDADAKAKLGSCQVKDLSVFLGRSDGLRGIFAFPTIQEAAPDAEVVTDCVKLSGLGVPMPVQMQRGSPMSVNGAAFMAGPLTVKDGDEIRVRLKASSKADDRKQEYLQFGGAGSFGGTVGSWGNLIIRTRNTARPAKVFQVGASRSYKQINELVNELSAGDVVEVDSGTYAPFELKRAGSKNAPITIRGVGATRPIVSGGNWGVSFRYSDNIVLENFEITGATTICLRTMANNITIRNVYIHDCMRHGVLGADLDNGTNIFDRVEITRSGSVIQGESYNHALYVATDRDSFPDAVLRVQQSYFHGNKGNSIKSRAGRAEIYSNWIDVPNDPDSFYSLELIGYQEYATDKPINADVVGNVLVHRKTYGLRLGGDGTGTSKGRVRMANNTVIVSALFGEYSPVIRLDQEFDSLYLLNNAFVLEQGANFRMRLLRSGVSKWVSGQAKVAGSNNALPANAYMDNVAPLNTISLQSTVSANSFIANALMASLDVTPLDGSKLIGAALPLTTTASGYEIPNPLLKATFSGFSKRPIPTQLDSAVLKSRASESFTNIGAY
jgi:pectate lyase